MAPLKSELPMSRGRLCPLLYQLGVMFCPVSGCRVCLSLFLLLSDNPKRREVGLSSLYLILVAHRCSKFFGSIGPPHIKARGRRQGMPAPRAFTEAVAAACAIMSVGGSVPAGAINHARPTYERAAEIAAAPGHTAPCLAGPRRAPPDPTRTSLISKKPVSVALARFRCEKRWLDPNIILATTPVNYKGKSVNPSVLVHMKRLGVRPAAVP